MWCLPAPSETTPWEREFFVDSGASTANGEVQSNEEATVYVQEFDLFVTGKLLEDTPAVLSLGKLCEDHGYANEWITGQLAHLIEDGRKIQCHT